RHYSYATPSAAHPSQRHTIGPGETGIKRCKLGRLPRTLSDLNPISKVAGMLTVEAVGRAIWVGGEKTMRACLRLLVVAVAATTGAGTYRAVADEPPPAPTPPAETTPAPTPPAASAEEVEALKKQNAELRQRVEELSGEMDQVKK